MKKLLSVLLAIFAVSGAAAFAATPEPTVTATPVPSAAPTETAAAAQTDEPLSSAQPSSEPEPSPDAVTTDSPIDDTASSLDFDITVIEHDYITDSTMKLELYSMSDELLGTFEQWIGGETRSIHAHFDIPEYKIGEQFRLKTADGVNYMKYSTLLAGKGNSLVFATSGYFDKELNYFKNTSFSIECDPCHEKGITLYLPDGPCSMSQRARILDGVAMVPVRTVAEKLGLKVRYDEAYNSVVCSAGSDEIIFNVGSAWTTALGCDFYAPHAACNIGGTVFVPVRTLADAARSSIEVKDYGDRLDIAVGDSGLVRDFRNRTPVNERGIASDTSYLVWISKHEFKTRVYTGSRYNWELEKEFTCAIGAPGSETITGTFKYQYRMPSWDYGTYYVGPCLVFYGNYAMHSTLLYYGGGEYDGTVGAKISHGCVRLHPQDINWIDSYVPVKSTVYITE